MISSRININRNIIRYKNSVAHLSSRGNDYNYLEKSIIPTMHFQKSLTKLKIPKLEDTFERYLTALKPLLSEAEFKDAEKCTRSFQANGAGAIDKEIRDLDSSDPQGNYISESWFDMYLKDRSSIVLNYNPFIAFAVDPNPGHMNQAIRATNMLISSVRFMKSLRENKLKPEIFHLNPEKSDTVNFQRLMRLIPESVSFYGAYMFNAYPLDMSQYFRLFNSSRIPQKGKDILVSDSTKNHVLVVHKGNFFTFPVLNADGSIVKPEEMYACIRHILDSNVKENEFPLGVLTSENRDVWADTRAKLVELGNADALAAIDSAIYCIALDETETNDPDVLCPNFLHGDAKNRWFDKNYTIIVNRDGHAALNFEHSWGDGVAVLRLFNEIYNDTTKNPQINPQSKPEFNSGNISNVVKHLKFNIDDSVKHSLKQATDKYQKATSSVKLKNFEVDSWGRNFVKNYKLSPDSIMQSAFQVAYYKVYGKFVATYESASTSAFKKGRTETIRPATMATKQLAEFMAKGSSLDPKEVVSILQDCTKNHNKLVKNGAMGQGFDRHLFAMKYHVETRKKQELPDFYKSHAYKFINHNILSTSTLAYPAILTGGFAPVVSDGFGLGYRILDNSLGASITSYQGDAELNRFVNELVTTFERIHESLKASK